MNIKVVYIMPTPSLYGDNLALLNILPVLVDLGCVPLLVIGEGETLRNEIEKHHYNYIVTKAKRPNKWLSSSKIRSLLCYTKMRVVDRLFTHQYNQLRRQIQSFSPDLIHTNLSSTQLGYQLAKDLGVSHVWHIREYGDLLFDYYPSLKSFKGKFNYSNSYGIAITGRIKSHFKLGPNVRTIYDGVFSEKSPRPHLREKENFFVIVGRIVPIKGIHMVIAAFANFIKSISENYQLIIIGDGCDNKYNHYLEKQVHALGIQDKVVFAGYQRNIADYLARAKCLISACSKEAFGFTVAEAMYNGCEVIGVDSAGTAVQMDNIEKKLGRKVCKRFLGINQLTKAFIEVVNNPLTNQELIEIQKAVINLYSSEQSAEMVFDFYKDIIHKEDGNEK